MDERQKRVFDALESRSKKLAGIYLSLLGAMSTSSEPDFALARLSVICHCARELTAGIPDAMSDTHIPRPSPSSGKLLAQLPELLVDVDLEVDQDYVPVPRTVARTLDEVIKSATRERGRNQQLARALITGTTENDDPAIKQWTEARDFFESWHHLDRHADQTRDIPSDTVVIAQLRVVEDVIETRTGLFFASLHAVEDILAEANRHDEDTQ